MEDLQASEAWRIFRIQAELIDGIETLNGLGPAVTLFGSARTPEASPWYQMAEEVAKGLSDAGFSVITGGGPGIMEAGNRGAKLGKCKSVGLNIRLPHEQHANQYQDLSLDFRYFFVRKLMFVKYAVAYIIFPGGFGTMDELFESLTLIQTGKIRRFPLILFGTQYWAGLMDWMRQQMLTEGNISTEDFDLIQIVDTPAEALKLISDFCFELEMSNTDMRRMTDQTP
ncbi:MAG: TIGR00730 family Rossman fold protein [Gammaproteobacteria bacterium]|nr:TIGR00730 family Rossman fold protein [Gammaproteobacteria bacterium]